MARRYEQDKNGDEDKRREEEDSRTQARNEERTRYSTHDEDTNHNKVVPRFAKSRRVLALEGTKECVRPTAQVARAHRGRERQAANAAKSLHLQGANEGDGRVNDCIPPPDWDKCREGEEQNLQSQHHLMPRNEASAPQAGVDPICRDDTTAIGDYGEEIFKAVRPKPRGDVESE